MSSVWASIFEHPGTDPVADRTVLEGGGQRTLLVPVADQDDAPAVVTYAVDAVRGAASYAAQFDG